jgi:hypothetical protein
MYVSNNESGKVYRNTVIINLNDYALYTALLLGLPSSLLNILVQEKHLREDAIGDFPEHHVSRNYMWLIFLNSHMYYIEFQL